MFVEIVERGDIEELNFEDIPDNCVFKQAYVESSVLWLKLWGGVALLIRQACGNTTLCDKTSDGFPGKFVVVCEDPKITIAI